MASFDSLGLKPELLQALQTLQFETPTDIQEQAIPHILNSKQDLVALAQTGTGKTGAFSLPILSQIDVSARYPQAIILCPTRELCLQISKDIKSFLSALPGVVVTPIYGGDSFMTQLRALNAGPQIIVGTPGRTLDMINRGKLKLDKISWMVLDEADEMLKMGFKEELDAILKTSPETKQTLLFSATMDRTVEHIAKMYMKNSKEISTSKKNQGSANIKHEYYMVQARDKYEALKRILDVQPDIYGIIFCNTREETQHISNRLMQEHYTAAPISGDLSQYQREQVMTQFRNKQIRILVATDVAARGIDVKELTHVIHYGLPTKIEYYTHRSGRTGRAGSTGISIAIMHSREVRMKQMIEFKTGIKFQTGKIPTAQDICMAQLLHVVEKIDEAKNDPADLTTFLPMIEEKLAHLTREEIIHHLVSVELGRFINFYKNLPDIHTPAMREPAPFVEKSRFTNPHMTRMRLNVGRVTRFTVPRLFEVVNSEKTISGIKIGQITIDQNESFVDVDTRGEVQFKRALTGKMVDGVSMTVEIVPMGEGGISSPPPRRVSKPYAPPRKSNFAQKMRGGYKKR
jgi:ATP-dependent RNA helicase DeaD